MQAFFFLHILINILVETIFYISGFFDEYKVQENSIYLKPKSFVTNVFTDTPDQFNESLMNKHINFSNFWTVFFTFEQIYIDGLAYTDTIIIKANACFSPSFAQKHRYLPFGLAFIFQQFIFPARIKYNSPRLHSGILLYSLRRRWSKAFD